MKFRVANPCKCGCKVEEYNKETGYIGCPNCETKRDKTISWEGLFDELTDMIYHEGLGFDDYDRFIEEAYHRMQNVPSVRESTV